MEQEFFREATHGQLKRYIPECALTMIEETSNHLKKEHDTMIAGVVFVTFKDKEQYVDVLMPTLDAAIQLDIIGEIEKSCQLIRNRLSM